MVTAVKFLNATANRVPCPECLMYTIQYGIDINGTYVIWWHSKDHIHEKCDLA